MYENGIITREESYWLGFLYADGSIHRKVKETYYILSIGLTSKDKEHLEKLKLFIGKGTIKENVKTKSHKLIICSKELCDNLIKLGVIPNKTYENNDFVFKNISESLKADFIRGYFDGDGGFFKNGNKTCYGFVSINEKLLEAIRMHLYNKGIITLKSLRKDKNCFRLRVSGNPNSKKFGDYIYPDSSLYLQRKKDYYDNIPELLKTGLYKNVRWNNQHNKWMPFHKGKYLGLFKTQEEANKKLQEIINNE